MSLSLLRAQNPFEAIPEPRESPSPKVTGPTIEAIEIRGATRVSLPALRAMIGSRVGRVYDVESLRRDAQALHGTQRFSSVTWETERGRVGDIVRFVLVERPLIQAIEYEGDDTLTLADISERLWLREVRLQVETLLNADELPRAAVTLQELLAERGRRDITVAPVVEPTGQSTVKVVFRVEKKQ